MSTGLVTKIFRDSGRWKSHAKRKKRKPEFGKVYFCKLRLSSCHVNIIHRFLAFVKSRFDISVDCFDSMESLQKYTFSDERSNWREVELNE